MIKLHRFPLDFSCALCQYWSSGTWFLYKNNCLRFWSSIIWVWFKSGWIGLFSLFVRQKAWSGWFEYIRQYNCVLHKYNNEILYCLPEMSLKVHHHKVLKYSRDYHKCTVLWFQILLVWLHQWEIRMCWVNTYSTRWQIGCFWRLTECLYRQGKRQKVRKDTEKIEMFLPHCGHYPIRNTNCSALTPV